jgi:uncharacterized coiled-coil protein SlyX
MRRAPIALAAVLALSFAFTGSAQARCSVTCLNHRVKQLSSGLIKAEKTIASLSRTVGQQGQTIAQQSQAISGLTQTGKKVDALFECLFEVPITRYGAPGAEEGYLYKSATETFPTTALDVPFEGEPVSAWFLIDGCNAAETASIKAASALAPATSLRALLQPQRRRFP